MGICYSNEVKSLLLTARRNLRFQLHRFTLGFTKYRTKLVRFSTFCVHTTLFVSQRKNRARVNMLENFMRTEAVLLIVMFSMMFASRRCFKLTP